MTGATSYTGSVILGLAGDHDGYYVRPNFGIEVENGIQVDHIFLGSNDLLTPGLSPANIQTFNVPITPASLPNYYSIQNVATVKVRGVIIAADKPTNILAG